MKNRHLPKEWDLIIIGGGITGAGIFRESVRMGLKVLLVEQNDFSWGTSSRSSKLVHGGLRYLKEGHFKLTRDSVRERERLLKEAPGLVEPIRFLVPAYKGAKPGKVSFGIGLWIYDFIAHKKQHCYYGRKAFIRQSPHINRTGLEGGFAFWDAQSDDTRLVIRLIQEAIDSGGMALNYTAAREINRDARGRVSGLSIEDVDSGKTESLRSRAVINATGAWADKLHPPPADHLRLRPLRGSHLIFPQSLFNIDHGVSFAHPIDKRAVFLVPWDGVILVGTTDLDHRENLSREPRITREEFSYLLEAVHTIFPELNITAGDCIGTLSGIRPVIGEGKQAPSSESREHAVWKDKGLITVTGGKLTTFRLLAQHAINTAKPFLPPVSASVFQQPAFDTVPAKPNDDYGIHPGIWKRLYGRYGRGADELMRMSTPESRQLIPGTPIMWAEFPYAAKYERIRHLSDLLLRRVRIGLLTSQGGTEYIEPIRHLCQSVLPWDENRWLQEIKMYRRQRRQAYGLPELG
jgi:glycerol-3-phosphate dehydrogenase